MTLLIATLLLFAPQPQEEFKLSKNETRMIEAINKYRARYKLPPLTMDPTLDESRAVLRTALHAQLPRPLDLG